MKVAVYKSTKNGDKYLTVPGGTEVKKMNLPADIDSDLLSLSPFKTSLEIDNGDKRIGLDTDDVIAQINEKGFAIHGATTIIIEIEKQ